MNILITGCKSFLAKEILDYFDDKKHILIPTDRTTLDVSDSDVVNEYFQNNDIGIVIHTAIKGGRRNKKDTTTDYINNLNMFGNLLKNRDKYKLMFSFGSGAEFNRVTGVINAKAPHYADFVPLDFYGAAKNIIARQIHELSSNIINLRLFGCFGKHENEDRFIKSAINNINNKNPIMIHQNKKMDFFSAQDVCRVIEHYIENYDQQDLPKDINLCYDKKNTLKDISDKICNLMNVENDVIINQDEMASEYTGCSKNLNQLNVKLDGLDIGLQRMIESIDTVKEKGF